MWFTCRYSEHFNESNFLYLWTHSSVLVGEVSWGVLLMCSHWLHIRPCTVPTLVCSHWLHVRPCTAPTLVCSHWLHVCPCTAPTLWCCTICCVLCGVYSAFVWQRRPVSFPPNITPISSALDIITSLSSPCLDATSHQRLLPCGVSCSLQGWDNAGKLWNPHQSDASALLRVVYVDCMPQGQDGS